MLVYMTRKRCQWWQERIIFFDIVEWIFMWLKISRLYILKDLLLFV